jgi:hypothetical protein
MATKEQFVRPRDEHGKFIPKEQWSKKDQKAFERMKRQGVFKNPIVKSKKTGEEYWVHPRDPVTKQWLPEEKWSKRQKRLFKKAQKEGLLPRSVRGGDGKFVSTTGKKKAVREEIRERRTDIYERIAHLEGLIEGALSTRQPGIVYIPGQMPQQQGFYQEPQSAPPQASHPLHVQQVVDESGTPVAKVYTDEEGNVEAIEEDIGPTQIDLGPGFGYREPVWGAADRQLLDEAGCDSCQEMILEGQERVASGQDLILRGQAEERRFLKEQEERDASLIEQIEDIKELAGSTVKKNALRRRPYVNPLMYRKKSFSRRFVELVDYFRDRPLMAILGVGALAVLGYTLYRLVRTYASTFRPGAAIANGVMSFPGTPSYQITQDDMVWMARAIWGEVNRDPAAWARADVQKGAAAVLWAFANNYMTVGRKRQIFSTFGDFVQAYSQPINPRWDESSDTKCQQVPSMCTADRLAFRQALRAKGWNTFPVELQNVVTRFVQGTLYNPIGRRTDFRAANTGYQPGDRMIVAGNVFGTDPAARQRQVVA